MSHTGTAMAITYTRTAAGNYIVRAHISPTGSGLVGSFVGRIEKTAAGWAGVDTHGVEIGPAYRTRDAIAKVLVTRRVRELKGC